MRSCRSLMLYICVAALLLVSAGCGAKPSVQPSGSGKVSASTSSPARQSVSPAASASVKASASAQASASASASVSASASASASATLTAKPTPAPTPSPTETPMGTVVDGWVMGIPAYVPKFACGTLDRSQSTIVQGSTGTLFTLCFRGVTKAGLQGYTETLRSAGYTAADMQNGSSYTLTASYEREWDSATIIIHWDETTGTAVYSLEAPV